MAKKQIWLDGVPVLNARAAVLVVPNEQDMKHAICNDPRKCVMARCLHRTLGSKMVMVYRTVAYAEVNERGSKVVYKYRVTQDLWRAIIEFDKTKKWPPGAFYLIPPDASRAPGAVKRKGRTSVNSRPTAAQRKAKAKDRMSYYRQNAGALHFTVTK